MGGYKKSKKKSLGQALFAFFLFTTRDHLVEIWKYLQVTSLPAQSCGYLSYCTTYYVFMLTRIRGTSSFKSSGVSLDLWFESVYGRMRSDTFSFYGIINNIIITTFVEGQRRLAE